MARDVSKEPRYPRGTPVAPGGHGPGGGRWMGAVGVIEGSADWAAHALGRPGQRHHGGYLGLDSEQIQNLMDNPPDPRLGAAHTLPERGAYAVIDGMVEDGALYGEIRQPDGSWKIVTGAQAAILRERPESDTMLTFRLAHHPYKEKDLDGGNMAQTVRRTYDDGRVVVIKWAQPVHANAEYLASLVGEAIGAPVPSVWIHPDDAGETWMGYVQGRSGMHFGHSEAAKMGVGDSFEVADAMEQQFMQEDPAWRLGLLDMLVDNHDRHPGNWMVAEPGGEMVGIDHGLAWVRLGMGMEERPEGHGGGPPLWMADWTITQRLLDPEHSSQWNPDIPLSPAEVDQIDQSLRALQPEFDRLGRSDWYHFTMGWWEVFRDHVRAQAG